MQTASNFIKIFTEFSFTPRKVVIELPGGKRKMILLKFPTIEKGVNSSNWNIKKLVKYLLILFSRVTKDYYEKHSIYRP